MTGFITDYSQTTFAFLSTLFIFAIGLAVLFGAVVFVIDIAQHKDAIRILAPEASGLPELKSGTCATPAPKPAKTNKIIPSTPPTMRRTVERGVSRHV